MRINLTDVGIVATKVQIVLTEDLSIDWVPVFGTERSVGEVGAYLNPSSDYDSTITGEGSGFIGQPEFSIAITLRDHCNGRASTCTHNIFILGWESDIGYCL